MIGKESVIYSLRNLKNRKTRSLFTLFSIMMGITMIFIFVSFGLGLYKYVDEISSESSADKVLIQPKGSGGMGESFIFSEEELEAVEKTSGVYDASGIYFKVAAVQQNKVKKYTYIFAFDPKKPMIVDVSALKLDKGRELKTGDRAVILGSNYLIPDKIFPKAYSLNDNIEINGKKVKVIGFYEPIGSPQDDMQVYITNDFIQELYPNENLSYNWLVAKVDVSNIDSVVENIEKNLRKERGLEKGKEDFYVQSFDDMIESYANVMDIIIGFIILIALISILVSAVNTANTMVTSVLERVKEIGVMKSIGGTNSEIFGIFLFESSFLGFLAGVVGVFFGWILSFIGGKILGTLGYSFLSPYFPIELFLGCIAFAVLTGAISGVVPAIKAMKTNPIDALRYE